MKTAAMLLATATLALAQGNLAPPGAPAAGMKTLAQIEPRTDVLTLAGDANVMHLISAPGAYFLAGNLTATGAKSGIRITASNVTLSLEGFLISGSGDAGIDMVGTLKGIVITGGSITGFNNLIKGAGALLKNSRISQLTASGASNMGINLGSDPSNTVEHCTIRDSLLCIQAGQVHHCTAVASSGGQAISASRGVSHSTGIASGSGSIGISAGTAGAGFPPVLEQGIVTNCSGEGHMYGITATLVQNSTGQATNIGIEARIISYSHGNAPGNIGLKCTTAVGSTSSGGDSITNKYLMP